MTKSQTAAWRARGAPLLLAAFLIPALSAALAAQCVPEPPCYLCDSNLSNPCRISQNIDPCTVDTSAVTCVSTATGESLDTIMRKVLRPEDDQRWCDVTVTDVEVGVFEAVAGNGVSQPLVITIWNDTTPETPPYDSDLIMLGTQTVQVPDTCGTLGCPNQPQTYAFTLANPVVCTPMDTIVVECRIPDGFGTGNSMFLGGNLLGTTGTAWWQSPACGLAGVIPMISLGVPNTVEPIINIKVAPTDSPTFPGTGEDLYSAAGPAGFFIGLNASYDNQTFNEGEQITWKIFSPEHTFDNEPFALFLDTFSGSAPVASPLLPGGVLWVDPFSASVVLDGTAVVNPLGHPLIVTPAGTDFLFQIPVGTSGTDFVLQPAVISSAAANGIFALANALVGHIQ